MPTWFSPLILFRPFPKKFVIVYTSNVFALLGLRASYFALAGIMQLFRYLHYSLPVILVFIGAKLMLSNIFHIDLRYALLAVGGILAISIIASLLLPGKGSGLPPQPDVYEGQQDQEAS